MKVIIINGKPRSGKDTFVDVFSKIYKHRVKNYSSVDLIKKILYNNFNWDGEKTDKSRKFISDIKKSWIEYNNGPKNYIIDKINKDINFCNTVKIDSNNNIYFIHIREIEEIEKLKEHFKNDCITILLNRKKNEMKFNNNSDNDNIFNFNYDFIINNNGNINNFKKEITKFINNEIYKS